MAKATHWKVLLAAAVLFAFPATAHAGLHKGSHGRRVRDVQWLLAGHQPSHYRTIRTFPHKPNGYYGERTAKAVPAAKWRMGYPAKAVNRTAGKLFFDLLLGREKRPLAWIGIAAKRQARLKHDMSEARLSACQRRVVQVARSQLGVREEPDGSNWGPQVANYQAVTGAYHAPWCASFAQWVLVHAGYGPFANRSAGVFYIASWARERGLLRATARPGVLVLFLQSSGHMGIVEKVVQHGFYSIEGNASNQVERRYHDFSAETVFVYLPHCSQAAILHNPDGSIFLDVFGIRLTRGQVFLGVLLFLVGLFLKQPHHWRLPRYRKR